MVLNYNLRNYLIYYLFFIVVIFLAVKTKVNGNTYVEFQRKEWKTKEKKKDKPHMINYWLYNGRESRRCSFINFSGIEHVTDFLAWVKVWQHSADSKCCLIFVLQEADHVAFVKCLPWHQGELCLDKDGMISHCAGR